MFARQFRLPAYIRLSNASFVNTPFFSAKIAKNMKEHNRYGFVVSKKIDKRAVIRNQVKRRFRAGLEQLHPTLPQGYDMIFVLKEAAKDADQQAFIHEMKTIHL